MKWVKGELLTEIDAQNVDPTRQLDRNAQNTLFMRHEWFARVWRYFPTPAITPIIARVTSEGSICWLFLARQQGGVAVALANWYSFAFTIICKGAPDPAHKRAMITAIAKRLGQVKPALSKITLSPVPVADGSSACIERGFTRGGWKAFPSQISTSWTANVAGMSFTDYWAARPGQLRNTYTRKKNKAVFVLDIFDTFSDAAWADYEDVYNDSWKPEEGAASFLRETAQHESEQGCLRLGICRIEGTAVAAQFWTVENGVAYIHKLAHRETAKPLSPGTILSHAMFEHVIDVDKVHSIDFGTGNDAYKADWMDQSEPLNQIILYNQRTVSGWLGGAGHSLKSWAKRKTIRTNSED